MDNMRRYNYYSVIDAISGLQARGFLLDFSLINNKLFCAQEKCYLGADEFDVLEIHRFYVVGRTRAETNVYAIETYSRSLKGILLNSCNQSPGLVSRSVLLPEFGRS
jgi:hypothetical protein